MSLSVLSTTATSFPVSSADSPAFLSSSSLSSSSSRYVFGSGLSFDFTFTFDAASQVPDMDIDMEPVESATILGCDGNGNGCCNAQTEESQMDVDWHATMKGKKRRHEEIVFDPVRSAIDDITFGVHNMGLFCAQTEADIAELCEGIDSMNFDGHSRMHVDDHDPVVVDDGVEDEVMSDVEDEQVFKRSRRC